MGRGARRQHPHGVPAGRRVRRQPAPGGRAPRGPARALTSPPLRTAPLLLACALVAACSGDDDDPDAAGTTTTAAAPSTATTAEPLDPVDGEDGLGDPYFPDLGGTGFQVDSYALDLDITADGRRLDGTATLDAEALDDLASYTLDLIGLEVASATVDGAAAAVERDGREVRLRPADPIADGDRFTVVVAYGGEPRPIESPALGEIGWLTTPAGSFVIGEPEGAATWFPANDHPSDKATFHFDLTVPEGVEAIANGVLVEQSGTTWRWSIDEPMATYLAQVAVGQFTLSSEPGPGGVEIRNAIADAAVGSSAAAYERQGEMLGFFAERFGPYPFDAYGALVVDAGLGLALETQTLSLFGAGPVPEVNGAHELAHQWFGNTVTPAPWDDIWLNEGFATYAQWLWNEHADGLPLVDQARASHAGVAGFGELAPGDPGPDQLFHPAVYERGALTLFALRAEIGPEAFDTVLRRWATERAGGNGSTEDFVALAEEVAGEPLEELFREWLDEIAVPPFPAG